ncbi:hypothetical protein YC2023_010384 [Brassica napus]
MKVKVISVNMKSTTLKMGFPASRVIPLDPVRQRSTSPGRALPGLDRTQYRFGVQKRQGSFRMGGNRTRMVVATTDPSCHLDYLGWVICLEAFLSSYVVKSIDLIRHTYVGLFKVLNFNIFKIHYSIHLVRLYHEAFNCQGFPASRVIPLNPVRQRSTSPGRALPGLDRTQYRFGVQKRQGSFRMGGNRTRMVVATTDPSCHLDYLGWVICLEAFLSSYVVKSIDLIRHTYVVRLYHEAFNCQVQFTSTMDQLFSVCMMSKILHRGSPLRGSFPWIRLGSGPLHPGGLYLGWIEPSTALVSRRGRVVSAWGKIEPGWWLPPQTRPATWTTSSEQN